jgi:hypothetical protein
MFWCGAKRGTVSYSTYCKGDGVSHAPPETVGSRVPSVPGSRETLLHLGFEHLSTVYSVSVVQVQFHTRYVHEVKDVLHVPITLSILQPAPALVLAELFVKCRSTSTSTST